jgi:predicted naringenin-chalcone synthase
MFVIGLGTAVPNRRYTQAECWEAFQNAPVFGRLERRSQTLLRKVLLGDNGIATRHFALNPIGDTFDLTPDMLHTRFAQHAPALAEEAARKALRDAGVPVEAVDAVIASTCTGYLCPGLTSYVSEQLGLRRNALALDLVGQGCGAALPNLRTAEALIAARRSARVLSVCTEVCSAASYIDDDPGVLISACLFGDGAAAAVLSGEPSPQQRHVRWHTAETTFSAEDRDSLRFERRDGKLRNLLAREVPTRAAEHAEAVLTETLARAELSRDQITGWILHGGGRDVLDALRDRLGLREEQVWCSRDVLRDYGNLSSPSVLFALQRALVANQPGGWWWLSSFGAGFSCHGALLRVD